MNMPFDGAKLSLFVGKTMMVILRDDDRSIAWPNHWDFPGGGREGAETPLECALRETKEELGLSIDPDLVVWGKCTEQKTGDKWFFVAQAAPEVVADVVFGDEGQRWDLMTPEQYCKLPNHIPRMAEQLQNYLVGNTGDLFERAPRDRCGGR